MGRIKEHYKRAIKYWPEIERPRERLFRFGEHNLTDSELLAILFCSGIKQKSALDLAREVIQRFRTFRNMAHTDLSHWRGFKGLGSVKLSRIRAAIEIGRRLAEEKMTQRRQRIKSSRDVADILMARMRDLKREVFKVLLLDSRNRIIEIIEVEEGTVNQARPIVRELFQRALQNFAAFIICVHNHPAGSVQPSGEDREFTKYLVQAGEILQIKVLDHIIIGDNTYFSFADKGLI